MSHNAVLAGLAAMTGLSLVVVVLCHHATRRAIGKHIEPCMRPLPPISVLKPLAGMDERLYENLLSIVCQDYPNFEIIFGIETPRDPACAVVRQLQRDYPKAGIRLVVGGPKIGVNPKVANLANMAAVALYDHVLISDANVRVGPDYLRSVASATGADVGLVCNIIVGSDAQSWGALCEDLHLNTFVTPSVCAAFTLGKHPCVVGKSMLLRLEHLKRLGGWHAVANVLAEDYVLGQMLWRAGFQVVLSPYVIHAVHERRSFWAFIERHVRWSQMRWRLAPAAYVSELVLNTAPWAWTWALASLPEGPSGQLLCASLAWATKMALDMRLYTQLSKRPARPRHALALVIKDITQPAIWILGIVCRSVTWRGHSMRIGRGSVVRACVDATFPLHAET